MEHRQLGRSGLRVSALALGTNTFGGRGIFSRFGSTDVPAATRLLDLCLDAGVTLFDTADEYSDGLSEEILGAAVKGRREKVLLATKVRTATGEGPNDAGLSRYHLIRACEDSLRRLGTDYIDLYQLHAWDGQTALEETLEALDTLVRAGKVRYVGACNFSAWHVMKAACVGSRFGYQPLACHHIHYSLVARDAEFELIPAALDQGLGTLVWSPLAGGWLSGKYRRDRPAPPGSRYASDWNEPPIRDEVKLYDLIDLLVEIGSDHGVSAACVALAWLLRRPGVTSLVIGARNEDQLVDNLGAARLELSDEDHARLADLSMPDLIYPYWHQAKIAADRLSAADLALLQPYLTDAAPTAAPTDPGGKP